MATETETSEATETKPRAKPNRTKQPIRILRATQFKGADGSKLSAEDYSKLVMQYDELENDNSEEGKGKFARLQELMDGIEPTHFERLFGKHEESTETSIGVSAIDDLLERDENENLLAGSMVIVVKQGKVRPRVRGVVEKRRTVKYD